MTRRQVALTCDGAQLVGTIDPAPGDTGLLIVSGGNEIRSGSWGGQSLLAASVAAAGSPVFRYDRRGVGDSGGSNGGYRSSAHDLASALAAFRAEVPTMRRVIAFGNCDAASALALYGTALPFDGLVLANPWTIDDDCAPQAMPAAAIRSRYLEKLKNPKEWARLLRGQINLGKLLSGLRRAAAAPLPESRTVLARDMHARLADCPASVVILLAAGDRTAQIFGENWPKDDPRIRRLQSRSHSFSGEEARAWLLQELLEVVQRR